MVRDLIGEVDIVEESAERHTDDVAILARKVGKCIGGWCVILRCDRNGQRRGIEAVISIGGFVNQRLDAIKIRVRRKDQNLLTKRILKQRNLPVRRDDRRTVKRDRLTVNLRDC